MKIRVHSNSKKNLRRKPPVSKLDGSRRHKLHSKLLRASEQKRRKQLANEGKKQVVTLAPSTKLTITRNRMGNGRGMNPSSQRDSSEMKRVRLMRKLYNKQMPVPQCNNCAFASSCPQYRAGYECAFLPFFQSHKVDSVDDMLEYMKELLGSNMRRMHQVVTLETLSGSMPSLETSEQLALLFSQFKDLLALQIEMDSEKVTLETDDTSIVGRLFGSMDELLLTTGEGVDEKVSDKADIPLALEDNTSMDASVVNLEVMNAFSKQGLEKDAKTMKGKELPKISSAKLAAR